ncbi:Zinc finger protein ZAT9 [Sesamum alatum]|uniref:Zinc finger protein ZAT9 n=1 Tax=Sesamum alatum TaxID=300844 RepID=A0AAE2CWE5_9LAMI|nr:Zinc finger protein ZAT9 [Sesamum alatum]
MEEDQELKHMCKFCCKSFPCGRSLGGHMRSHLINTSSSSSSLSDQDKLPRKKLLPPLTRTEADVSIKDSGLFGRESHSKRTSKFPNQEDALLQQKLCKECGKSFQSWKALFGHMKCHSVNGKAANYSVDQDSCDDHHRKLIVDSQSDNEAATPAALCRRKRSQRPKRYASATKSSSSNFSPCVSEIDQQEQEEVALSLILLSKDKGSRAGVNSSSSTSSEPLGAKKTDQVLKEGYFNITSKSGVEFRFESEVNSPKNLNRERGMDQFGSDCKKESSIKRKSIGSNDSQLCEDSEKKSKFMCAICKKAFSSYQALGGHRASHKKFKGCCAPTIQNSPETENSLNQSDSCKLSKCTSTDVFAEKINTIDVGKRSKEHECPVCYKVFASGQALGGHKRSHLVSDHITKSSHHPSVSVQKPIQETRDFLDLNLPAPVEDECEDLKPWWIATGHEHEHGPLLGLLSS